MWTSIPPTTVAVKHPATARVDAPTSVAAVHTIAASIEAPNAGNFSAAAAYDVHKAPLPLVTGNSHKDKKSSASWWRAEKRAADKEAKRL